MSSILDQMLDRIPIIMAGAAIILFVSSIAYAEPIMRPDNIKYASIIESEHESLIGIKEDVDNVEFNIKKGSMKTDVLKSSNPKVDELSKEIMQVMPSTSKVVIDPGPMHCILPPGSAMKPVMTGGGELEGECGKKE